MSTYFCEILQKMSEEWISQAEAARLRGVTRQAIAKLVKKGKVRTTVFGGHTFVNKSDVLSFTPSKAGRPRKDKNGSDTGN